MKMSTMKAHTRLDLKTSSLIWEYCSVSVVGGGEGRREEGGRKGDRVRGAGGPSQTGAERRTPRTQRHAAVPTTSVSDKRERDSSRRVSR